MTGAAEQIKHILANFNNYQVNQSKTCTVLVTGTEGVGLFLLLLSWLSQHSQYKQLALNPLRSTHLGFLGLKACATIPDEELIFKLVNLTFFSLRPDWP